MSEFKFICPTCGQKIKTDSATSGREFDCPGCKSKLLIPFPSEQPGETPSATLMKHKKPTAEGGGEEEPTPDQEKPKPNRGKPDLEPEALSGTSLVQIGALTPAIKRQIVRSARLLISDQEHWMPRITEKGDYAYAAKMVDGKFQSVEVTNPEATHFSILGALMFELTRRNVTRTANGRAELLDHELMQAIKEVAGDETAVQEVSPGELPKRGKQVPSVSHAQCLEALELLDKRYTNESENRAGATSERREDLRLAQINRMIERKLDVSIEDLSAALTNELAEINSRLDDLERRS